MRVEFPGVKVFWAAGRGAVRFGRERLTRCKLPRRTLRGVGIGAMVGGRRGRER